MRRRRFIRYVGATGTVGAVGATGCLDEAEEPEEDDDEEEIPDYVEVISGPEGEWAFEPREVDVAVGGTVEWYFDSPGHNVSAHPDDDTLVDIPDDAEPFRSFDPAESRLNDVDTTFSHTFEVPGEYVYVCTPHVPQMRGTVVVHDV